MYIVKDLTANMFCVSVYERTTSMNEAKKSLEEADLLLPKARAAYPDSRFEIQKCR